MTRTCIIVLVASLLLPVCGCGAFRQAAASDELEGGSASPCLEQYGFAVSGFRAIRDNYGQVSVVGEIKNTGSASQGVELQASLRDAGGHIVAVGHFFPASYRNIVPDEAWPFTYSFGRQEDATEAELRIVGAFRTMDILNVASTTP
jgi:hypothetical protein